MLIGDFLDTVYVPRRLRGKSENTVRLYRVSIRNFERTLGRTASLDDLTDDNVSRHMLRQLADGRAKATVNKDRAQLLTLWRYACQTQRLTRWPDVLPEIEPVRVPKAWLPQDLKKLFEAIMRLDGTIGTVPEALWWLSLVTTCLETGERIGALTAARWDWLDGEWLIVPAEHRKGKRKDKPYCLTDSSLTRLSLLRGYSRGMQIWPWPYCHGYLWTRFGMVLKKAGLPYGRKDKFHRLRKTCASVLHQAGVDATEALDHTHRRTTACYLDPRFTREAKPSEIVANWLANPPAAKRKRLG